MAADTARPKGERVLSLAITVPETTNLGTGYDHAFRLAQSAGMETPGEITFYWDEVEHRSLFGNISYRMPFLDTIKRYIHEFDMRPVVTISPIETLQSRMPRDLRSLPFDHPKVKARFGNLIRWVHSQTRDMRPWAVVIGNEFDLYLNQDRDKWREFEGLYLEAIKVIRTLPGWKKVPVALEATLPGLTRANSRMLQQLNRHSDIIGVSYYPITNDSVEPLSAIARDLDRLESLYPDKRFDFYQYGYPSSEHLGSSEERQRQFIELSFREWDERMDKIRILTFTWLYDLDIHQLVDNARRTTGAAPDKVFTEFLGTLGLLRRKAGDEKPAFAELKKQAEARGWTD